MSSLKRKFSDMVYVPGLELNTYLDALISFDPPAVKAFCSPAKVPPSTFFTKRPSTQNSSRSVGDAADAAFSDDENDDAWSKPKQTGQQQGPQIRGQNFGGSNSSTVKSISDISDQVSAASRQQSSEVGTTKIVSSGQSDSQAGAAESMDTDADSQQQPDSTTSSPAGDGIDASDLFEAAERVTRMTSGGGLAGQRQRQSSEEDGSVVGSNSCDSPPPKRSRSMPPVFTSTPSQSPRHDSSRDNDNDTPISTTTRPDSADGDSRPNSVAPCPDPRPAFLWKLRAVLEEFVKCVPYPSAPKPNVEVIEGSKFVEKILTLAEDRFTNGIPFTIQRLCELITDPRAQYKRADKFLRAVEKNLHIVSTVDPQGQRMVQTGGDTASKPEELFEGESNEAQALPVSSDDSIDTHADFNETLSLQRSDTMEVNSEGEYTVPGGVEMTTEITVSDLPLSTAITSQHAPAGHQNDVHAGPETAQTGTERQAEGETVQIHCTDKPADPSSEDVQQSCADSDSGCPNPIISLTTTDDRGADNYFRSVKEAVHHRENYTP